MLDIESRLFLLDEILSKQTKEELLKELEDYDKLSPAHNDISAEEYIKYVRSINAS